MLRMLGKMAWRNLWRRRRRTWITLSSVGVGLWLTVTSVGMADASYQQMIDDSATMGFGHVTVRPAGTADTPSFKTHMPGAAALLNEVQGTPSVAGAALRVVGPLMMQSARKSTGGMLMAVDPEGETEARNLFLRSLVEGRMFAPGDRQGAVVGRATARQLGLRLGKKFVVTLVDADGEMVSGLFRVRGIFETGVPEVDAQLLMLPITSVRALLGWGEQAGNQLSVFIDDYRASASVRRALAMRLMGRGVTVETWRETQPELASLSDIDRGMNIVFLLLLGVLISAGVLNTGLMSVLERTQEFGMMLAAGMMPRQLFFLVVLESVVLSATGLVFGALLCAPWVWYLTTKGIDFSAMLGGDYTAGGVLVNPVIHIRLYAETVGGIVTALFGLSVLAAAYPAWMAARLHPMDAMRKGLGV